MRMGLREANQRFSKAIKAVKAGKEVVLTERGEAIAVIKPLGKRKNLEAKVRQLEAEGFLRASASRGRMPRVDWKPVRLRGKPLSETVSQERDER